MTVRDWHFSPGFTLSPRNQEGRAGEGCELGSERLRRAVGAGIQALTGDLQIGVGGGGKAGNGRSLGFLWAALIAAPASADDLSSLGIETTPPAPVIGPGPATYINFLDEVRVGVYAHNWIHDENSPVDVSGELLSSPIGYPNNVGGQWFSWFFDPRINIGAMINTGGKTSYGFTGLTWRIPIYKGFSSRVSLAPRSTLRRCVTSRAASTLAAAGISANRAALATSSASTGIYRQRRAHLAREPLHPHQPGLTQVGARIGYKF